MCVCVCSYSALDGREMVNTPERLAARDPAKVSDDDPVPDVRAAARRRPTATDGGRRACRGGCVTAAAR